MILLLPALGPFVAKTFGLNEFHERQGAGVSSPAPAQSRCAASPTAALSTAAASNPSIDLSAATYVPREVMPKKRFRGNAKEISTANKIIASIICHATLPSRTLPVRSVSLPSNYFHY